MNIFDELSSAKGSRKEDANKMLGKKLAKKKDKKHIKQLSEGLSHDDRKIRYDCLSTFEYIAQIDPKLVAPYWENFLGLIESSENKLIWGAMIVLALIAEIEAKNLYKEVDRIKKAMEEGSVITIDRGVVVVSEIAASNKKYNEDLFPYLLDILEKCRAKSIPQYAETISKAVNAQNKEKFIKMIEKQKSELKPNWKRRVGKVMNKP